MGSGHSISDNSDSKKVVKTVLPHHLAGGPHNLGDPEDKTLRTIEVNEIIPQRMREIIKAEKCTQKATILGSCLKAHQFSFAVTCVEEKISLKQCIRDWNENTTFRKEVTDQYLKDRSLYRSSGLTQQHRELLEQLEKSKKKSQLKKQQQQQQQEE